LALGFVKDSRLTGSLGERENVGNGAGTVGVADPAGTEPGGAPVVAPGPVGVLVGPGPFVVRSKQNDKGGLIVEFPSRFSARGLIKKKGVGDAW
jgi:hypothetical protein